ILKKDIESAGHLMASVCNYWITYIHQTWIRLEPRFVGVEVICADTNNDPIFAFKVLLYRAKRCNFRWTDKCKIPRIEEENNPLAAMLSQPNLLWAMGSSCPSFPFELRCRFTD